jgi:predicted ATP-grasp superfamily ATP-dependent carboligase
MLSLGWQGFADFDTIEDPKDGNLKIMELNPRVPACVKVAVKSGIDWGNILVDETLGNSHKKYDYVTGKKLRHIGFEVLWFFYSKNRFKNKPNWFNFFDKNLSFQDFSWKDPLPFFFGTIGNIQKQLSPEFRRSKSGTR